MKYKGGAKHLNLNMQPERRTTQSFICWGNATECNKLKSTQTVMLDVLFLSLNNSSLSKAFGWPSLIYTWTLTNTTWVCEVWREHTTTQQMELLVYYQVWVNNMQSCKDSPSIQLFLRLCSAIKFRHKVLWHTLISWWILFKWLICSLFSTILKLIL